MQSWSRQKATEKSGSFVMMPRLPLPIAEVKKRAPGDRDPLTILAFRTNSSHDDATEAERPGRIDPLALSETRLISVERVLASVDEEQWNKHFTELYANLDMLKTLASEAIGAGQLLAGHAPKYGSHPYTGFLDPLPL